jgi:phosphomannomutase
LKCSALRKKYPEYIIAKKKLTLQPGTEFSIITNAVRKEFQGYEIDERDGLKIDCPGGWVQIRKSNTEPIMRIYAEGRTQKEADDLAEKVIVIVKKI